MAVEAKKEMDVSIHANHYIGGSFHTADEGETFTNENPATGEDLCEVPVAREEEVEEAVQSANEAFEEWGQIDPKDRSTYLREIADVIEDHLEELAYLETLDSGKPFHLAKEIDIPRAASNFRFFADFIQGMHTEAYEMKRENGLNYVLRRPAGVAGLIVPWNLPLLLLTWKVAPALAAGDTIVAKPAEQTPLTATRLAELIDQECELPEGVFNLVHGFGPDSAGEFISRHPDIDILSFTGENKTGKAIMAQAADSLKKLSFEMGGRNPLLAFEDANMDELIETTIRSNFVNQGEVCLSPDRIYVQRPIYNEFVKRFVEEAEQLKTGDPFDEETYVGALISGEHFNKVTSYIEKASQEGAEIHTGGKPPSNLPDYLENGHFLEPTIVTGVDPDSATVCDEIFGPVSMILPFDSEEEAIQEANDTNYGLTANLWTSDLSRAHRVAGQLEAGIIWVNEWYLRDLRTPFGGMSDSGLRREGGHYSFEFYSKLKNVCIQL